MIDLLNYIGSLFTGTVNFDSLRVDTSIILLDHGVTLSFCIIALKEFFSKTPNRSAQVSTAILAISYIASSINFYFFNFMMSEEYYDFSLYLSYTFLDSLTVLCTIFAHAYYRMRFSFSANIVCYMVLTNTYLQFALSILVFVISTNTVAIPDRYYYAFGGFYGMAINVICWGSVLILLMPIKAQSALVGIRNLAKELGSAAIVRVKQ